jgi:hypothetical protein
MYHIICESLILISLLFQSSHTILPLLSPHSIPPVPSLLFFPCLPSSPSGSLHSIPYLLPTRGAMLIFSSSHSVPPFLFLPSRPTKFCPYHLVPLIRPSNPYLPFPPISHSSPASTIRSSNLISLLPSLQFRRYILIPLIPSLPIYPPVSVPHTPSLSSIVTMYC